MQKIRKLENSKSGEIILLSIRLEEIENLTILLEPGVADIRRYSKIIDMYSAIATHAGSRKCVNTFLYLLIVSQIQSRVGPRNSEAIIFRSRRNLVPYVEQCSITEITQ